MNDSNLKPFNTWNKKRHRIVSRIGGLTSGISRREKAAYRRILKLAIKFSSPSEAALYRDELDNLVVRKGQLCDRRDRRK